MNLLTDPLLRVRYPSGSERAFTLPEVFTHYAQGHFDTFAALRRHHEHPWHAFLVQLAFLAIQKTPLDLENAEPTQWRNALIRLAGSEDAWDLVSDAPTRPAFMQPPLGDDEDPRTFTRNVYDTPDGLDLTIASRNHTLKVGAVGNAQADDWIYALVTHQTFQGFSGASMYGIGRMYRGYGNRLCLSLTPADGSPASRFLRDAKALLASRGANPDLRPALLWTLPWGGAKEETLALSDVNPLAIECCRRLRMLYHNGRLVCGKRGTQGKRFQADDEHGVTGDPWALTNREKQSLVMKPSSNKAFTTYQLVTWLDTRLFEHGLMLRPQAQDLTRPTALYGNVLLRGQGITEGFHETFLPLHETTVRALHDQPRNPQAWNAFIDLARQRMDLLRQAGNFLTFALRGFYLNPGGNAKDPQLGRTIARALATYQERVYNPEVFFPDLQLETRHGAGGCPAHRNVWLKKVLDTARAVLADTLRGGPGVLADTYDAHRTLRVFERQVKQSDSPFQPYARDVPEPLEADDDEPQADWNHPASAVRTAYLMASPSNLPGHFSAADRKHLQRTGSLQACRKLVRILGCPRQEAGVVDLAYWPVLFQAQALLQGHRPKPTHSTYSTPGRVLLSALGPDRFRQLLEASRPKTEALFLRAMPLLHERNLNLDWKAVAAWLRAEHQEPDRQQAKRHLLRGISRDDHE